ncbi:PREDICTED: uncharacterized protein LOC101302090 [Fragaria vesca subsp. vesca]|uniref:uncharacterized protein LOC101302090 n=1 Tax=Fragaria vesca subsp. vesca TaxID=101020 RepID=UPI0002C33694|nr:PREDICTED: uncharacterized protein LOC101302090 [Fragaria vesca subsp. vesca]
MESEANRKRMKPESREVGEGGVSDSEMAQREEFAGSEEVELSISQILTKIDRFTEMISELLDSGKAMFKKISDEYEERLIMIHKEQMEKWQEEIRELRAIDVSNEEAGAVLHNAAYLLQNPHVDS